MAKIHLRANKAANGQRPIARCASQYAGMGKVRTNGRQTYRYMASEIVGWDEFKAVDAADRCAHCCDAGLMARNRMRRDIGLSPVVNLFDPA